MSVFLVWDNSRIVHGEGPQLEGIFMTRELAEKYVDEHTEEEGGYVVSDLEIDEREVRE